MIPEIQIESAVSEESTDESSSKPAPKTTSSSPPGESTENETVSSKRKTLRYCKILLKSNATLEEMSPSSFFVQRLKYDTDSFFSLDFRMMR